MTEHTLERTNPDECIRKRLAQVYRIIIEASRRAKEKDTADRDKFGDQAQSAVDDTGPEGHDAHT